LFFTQDNPSWGLDYLDYPEDESYSWNWDGTGVHIYVVDTGIFTGHVDFGDRASCAFVLSERGESCEDDNGHGTNVASIAAGSLYGVAKNATLKGVKVLDSKGTGTMSGIAAGIDFVVSDWQGTAETRDDRPPAVINLR